MCLSLLQTIIGGLIGILGSVMGYVFQLIIAKYNKKSEHSKHIIEKREELYLKLVKVLDDIPIPLTAETGDVDTETLDDHLGRLAEAVDNNRGEILLFASPSIQNDLLQLNSSILNIIDNQEQQKFDLSSKESAQKSPIFVVIDKAKKMVDKMRKEIIA